MLILYGDGMLSFSPKFNKEKSITNNQLPAMSIRLGDIILGFDRSFFWISLPEAEIQVIKVELCCDIWLNFTLVTVQSCAVYMEMYRDSVIVLGFDRSFFWISLPEAKIQVIKVELCCDIWLNFALVTFRSCAFI